MCSLIAGNFKRTNSRVFVSLILQKELSLYSVTTTSARRELHHLLTRFAFLTLSLWNTAPPYVQSVTPCLDQQSCLLYCELLFVRAVFEHPVPRHESKDPDCNDFLPVWRNKVLFIDMPVWFTALLLSPWSKTYTAQLETNWNQRNQYMFNRNLHNNLFVLIILFAFYCAGPSAIPGFLKSMAKSIAKINSE